MTMEGVVPDSAGRDWEAVLHALRDLAASEPQGRAAALARRLARTLPEAELGVVVDELSAEQARLRADRFEGALKRARAAADRQDLALAVREAEDACTVDGARWEAHQLLGELHERAGDRGSALRRYMTAIHLGWDSDAAIAAVKRVK